MSIAHPRSGATRKHARLVGPRNRRVIARWLRRTAARADERHPLSRRGETLLVSRVAAVRTDLLQIASLLERTDDPDPMSMGALSELLANGCDSPLYNADIHISELYATLYYIRIGLVPTGRYDERQPWEIEPLRAVNDR